MRTTVPPFLEAGRVLDGPYASDPSRGFTGMFHVNTPLGSRLKIVANTEALGWEHVSVSLDDRCPRWDEMCFVKDVFWEDEETVLQFHPARSDYVNASPFCLHLWRPVGFAMPMPPTGVKAWTAWGLVRNAVGNKLVGLACRVRGKL